MKKNLNLINIILADCIRKRNYTLEQEYIRV